MSLPTQITNAPPGSFLFAVSPEAFAHVVEITEDASGKRTQYVYQTAFNKDNPVFPQHQHVVSLTYYLYGTLPWRDPDSSADIDAPYYNAGSSDTDDTTFQWQEVGSAPQTYEVDPGGASFQTDPVVKGGSYDTPVAAFRLQQLTGFFRVLADPPAATGYYHRVFYGGFMGGTSYELTWRGAGYPCAPLPRCFASPLKVLKTGGITVGKGSFLEDYDPQDQDQDGYPGNPTSSGSSGPSGS